MNWVYTWNLTGFPSGVPGEHQLVKSLQMVAFLGLISKSFLIPPRLSQIPLSHILSGFAFPSPFIAFTGNVIK